MKVKCLYNTGEVLMGYPSKPMGITKSTEYGLLKIDKEYIVMGIILGEGVLGYLIDDGGIISACPYQLFEIKENKLPPNWYFKAFAEGEGVYPYQEAIWGYKELVLNEGHYEKLIEQEDEAMRIYFRRKVEFEKELENL